MRTDKITIQRLTSAKEISAIFTQNKRVYGPLGLILWKNAPNSVSRVAYCVSKKHGNAVVRNRIKRVLRQLVHDHRGLFPSSTDFVFVPSAKNKEWGTDICGKNFLKLVERFVKEREKELTS